MKTEIIPERHVELKSGPKKFEKRELSEVSRFVASGIEQQSDAISRWSLSPTSTLFVGESMPEVVGALSEIEIVDPNIEKRVKEVSKKDRNITDDDIAFIASVALAKAKVVENEGSLDSKAKESLTRFKKTVLSGAVKRIGRVRGKALRITTAMALVLAACSTAVIPETPEVTQRVEAVATETIQVPTEAPTPTETEEVVEEAIEDESLLTELNEDKINELSEQLTCMGHTGCISESIVNPGVTDPNVIDFEFVSSGVFENIELRDVSTNKITGTMTVLKGVSKDKNEKPIVIRILLQIEMSSKPGWAALSGIYKTLIMMGVKAPDSVSGDEDVLDLKEWGEVMPESSTWTFNTKKNGTNLYWLRETYYTTQEYNQSLSEVIDSRGTNLPADFMLVPSGMGNR